MIKIKIGGIKTAVKMLSENDRIKKNCFKVFSTSISTEEHIQEQVKKGLKFSPVQESSIGQKVSSFPEYVFIEVISPYFMF